MTLSNTAAGRKYNSIDLCKLIMAILVIAIHTHPLENCTNRTVLTIYNQITQMAVPFFFLSSGYLLSAKFSSFSDAQKNIGITFRQTGKILKMYLVWSLIYLPLAILDNWRSGTSFLDNLLSYIRGLVFIGEHYNSWHLWYLLSTVYALILVMALFRFRLNVKKWIIVVSSILGLSIFMDEIAAYSKVLPTVLHLFRTLVALTTVNGRILQGAFFIPIGILMGNKNMSLWKCLVLFTGCFCANFFIENTAISTILTYVCGVALFGILLHINLKEHYIYIILRKLSTDIYLIHMYIFSFYCSLIHKEVHFGLDSFLVTAILSLALGLLHLRFATKKKTTVS